MDANAQAVATIRLAHRRDIQRARKITNAPLDELKPMADADTVAYLQELGEMLRSPDDNGMDKLNDLYQKVISLPEPARCCCAVTLTNCALSLMACASNLQMPPADLPALPRSRP